MQNLTIGGKTIDLGLISYVDLNYRVKGGSKRVLLELAKDRESKRSSQMDRLFFADHEAEQLRKFFERPEVSRSVLVVKA